MTSPRSPAVVLLGHGSDDPAWGESLEVLAERMRAREPGRTVAVAFLGGAAPTLAHAVAGLAACGHRSIRVVAVLLSDRGRHMDRDVPDLVIRVSGAHPGVDLRLVAGALGATDEVIEAMARVALARTTG
jgi:sirohydrochlorin cobaltochelatase